MNESERYKALAQKLARQLSNLCSSFMHEAGIEDAEKKELKTLRSQNTALSEKINQFKSCALCDELYESRKFCKKLLLLL